MSCFIVLGILAFLQYPLESLGVDAVEEVLPFVILKVVRFIDELVQLALRLVVIVHHF
jgi:hypothetical protein